MNLPRSFYTHSTDKRSGFFWCITPETSQKSLKSRDARALKIRGRRLKSKVLVQNPNRKGKRKRKQFVKMLALPIRAMGVEKEVLRPGTGPKPVAGQRVTVHCTGFGKNGDLAEKFWSTKDRGQRPFTFQIGTGKVIKGWDEGVLGMQVGEVARLRCSPDYAYGAGGFPAWGIEPNSTLVFEVEVLKLDG